ncbi:MAG TPA: bifunctional phosphopantothenoylcysteine decarboxylase/phosphopantothenate--cysteine ligase CoaBC [Acidimicrobiia bacterium]|nr:bifunctional phosphopantothenoylcysteine decarboxylase/phosphopantothenate--cysteine ligase CoaBC [Acidimicrobiia bacterium]
MLTGRRIVLGVSGGVAAYKSAILARRLIEQGAAVRTIMTRSAAQFIGPQTFGAITGEQPIVALFGGDDPSPHTHLAKWADAVVVAPATAATIARIASGLSEDALSTTVLAAWGTPLIVAPAMHTEMWEHPATQRNIATLRGDGAHIVGPARGALAGGDEGAGRMVEPEELLEVVARAVSHADLHGWRVIVTAGGTREPIDPVRYIGNRSSGKMGNAIAAVAARRGAAVTLVTSASPVETAGVSVVAVETAEEMADAVWSRAADMDVAVMAAAVADFRPAAASDAKLRRRDGTPAIELMPTPDVLAGVAEMSPRPFLVGFAAESGSLDEAVAKTQRKGVDLLVGNDVSKPGSGFGTETNEVLIVTPDGQSEPWKLMSKDEVAERLWDRIRLMRNGALD